jgi:membrane protease YdiL (CAAX protease family)
VVALCNVAGHPEKKELSMAETAALSPPDLRRAARRGLAIYFALVVVISGGLEAYIIINPEVFRSPIAILVLMWTPAVASVIARLVLKEGFSDVSFRFGGLRTLPWYALGLGVPLAVGILAYGSAWLTGLVGFEGSAGAFLVGLVSAATWITIYGFIFTAGEEIGWRGYMLTRLIDAGVPRPVLVSGLIWALWHVPLILAGIYAAGPYPALSAVLFVISVTSAAFVFARIRLETGSIWPAIFAHSAWNSIIQGPFDGAATGPNAALWTGESGILPVIVLVVVAVIVSRGSWTYIRSLPGRGMPLTEALSQAHSPQPAPPPAAPAT